MKFEVKGSGSTPYVVDTEELTCTCPNWRFKCRHFSKDNEGRLCKHLLKVIEEHPEYTPDVLRQREQVERQMSIANSDGEIRLPLAIYDNYVQGIRSCLWEICPKLGVCGEYRRGISPCNAPDIIVSTDKDIHYLINALSIIGDINVDRNDESSADFTVDGIVPLKLHIVRDNSWESSVLFTTGPGDYVLKCIRAAGDKQYFLSKSGLCDSHGEIIPVSSERELILKTGAPYLEPWNR